MKNKELLEQRPDVDNYDLQPYGYINALQIYTDYQWVKKVVLSCDHTNPNHLLCYTRLLNLFWIKWKKHKDGKFLLTNLLKNINSTLGMIFK